MAKSPGHQTHPDHTVREQRATERISVEIGGKVIADSENVIEVHEDGNPVRYYFPRGDVEMGKLKPTDTTSECPFKGHASYFSIHANGNTLKDAVWSYEAPYDEHADLKNRVAFWDEKFPDLTIRTNG